MELESCASCPSIAQMGREVFVNTVAPSKSSSRPDERRRHPRHKVPSIMYVELGSGNGGIVVNLGTDGVACQAANKVTTPKNSTLRVRLRGSGLSTEVDGKLVWLGATQKEVGISFSGVSSEVRQNIEDWIAREFRVGAPPAGDGRSRSKVMPALPGMSSTGMKSRGRTMTPAPALPEATTAALSAPVDPSVKEPVSRSNVITDPPDTSSVETKSTVHPLSAALAMSQATAETFSAPADVPSRKSVSGSIIPTDEKVPAAAPLESDPPVRNSAVPANSVDATNPNAQVAGSMARLEQSEPDSILPGVPVSEVSSVENAASPASGISPAHVVAAKPLAAQNQEQPVATAPVPAAVEISKKAESVVPRLEDRCLEAWKRLVKSAAWEKWIPPALIETWNKASRHHRFALAGTAAVCLVSFLLVLIFAVNTIVGGSAAEGSKPRSMAAASIGPGPLRRAATPAPPRVIVPPPSDASDDSTSMLANFMDTLLRSDRVEMRPTVALDEGHFGVQVWTSKPSGYYYCTDEPYYKSIRPGAYMSQRDALQSGYQPKLGQFCD